MIKLVDFGLSMLVDKSGDEFLVGYAGTRTYWAPEIEKIYQSN